MKESPVQETWVYKVWGEYPVLAETGIFFHAGRVELYGPWHRSMILSMDDLDDIISVSESEVGRWKPISGGSVYMDNEYQLVFVLPDSPTSTIVIGKNYVPHFRAYLREHQSKMYHHHVAQQEFENAIGGDDILVTIEKDSVEFSEQSQYQNFKFNLSYGEAAELVERLMETHDEDRLEFDETYIFIDDDGDLCASDLPEDEALYIARAEIPELLEFLEAHCTTTVHTPDEFFSPNPEEVILDIENPKDAIGQTKLDIGTIPTVALIEGALAMEQGELKYGRRNFRYADVKASVYIAALKRHILKYEAGEDMDYDTALYDDNGSLIEEPAVHHLGAVIACAAILLDAAAHESLVDDREYSDEESDLIDKAKERVAILRKLYGSDRRLLEERND